MENRNVKCAVIIVTHNSEKFIHQTMDCLAKQSRIADQIIIVDSASKDTSYLNKYSPIKNIQIILCVDNVGFCTGNNLGYGNIDENSDYVLFLNPDAFLIPRFIEKAVEFMEQPPQKQCGAMTGTLLGFDIDSGQPTGKYDSTGVFHTWYGKWYDRDQGNSCDSVKYTEKEILPAICGALMFCRKKALDDVNLIQKEVFDSSFYMYKEDIDLSCRLRKQGWQLILVPGLVAYHCRGWNADRSRVPRHLRLMSARNELKLHLRQRSLIGSFYSSLKYASVFLFNL